MNYTIFFKYDVLENMTTTLVENNYTEKDIEKFKI